MTQTQIPKINNNNNNNRRVRKGNKKKKTNLDSILLRKLKMLDFRINKQIAINMANGACVIQDKISPVWGGKLGANSRMP